jgi:hypothetical protein
VEAGNLTTDEAKVQIGALVDAYRAEIAPPASRTVGD